MCYEEEDYTYDNDVYVVCSDLGAEVGRYPDFDWAIDVLWRCGDGYYIIVEGISRYY